VVLLILVVVWAAVLGPSLLRRGVQRRSTDSIGAFHRQLRVLERTGPLSVDPAHRLDTSLPSAHVAERPLGSGRSGLIVVRPDAPLPVDLQEPNPTSSSRRPDPYFRPEACRRRRDVLLSLLVIVFLTGSVGAVPSVRPVLALTVVSFVSLVGYVALLVRLRNRALEREAKLRYLPTPIYREPIVTRRVAAR
jgi:hypothetical protein